MIRRTHVAHESCDLIKKYASDSKVVKHKLCVVTNDSFNKFPVIRESVLVRDKNEWNGLIAEEKLGDLNECIRN
jgi:hypothetical protein